MNQQVNAKSGTKKNGKNILFSNTYIQNINQSGDIAGYIFV